MPLPSSEAEVRSLVRQALQRLLPASEPATASTTEASQRRPLIDARRVSEAPLGSRLEVASDSLITPLAREVALERGIELASSPAVPKVEGLGEKAIAIAADHGGYLLKEQLKQVLVDLGWQPVDCGTHSTDSVDYPDYALAVARLVAEGRVRWGIIVDGAGIGSCMAANKVPGIRAALCYDLASAMNSREHNHANVLTLGAGLIGPSLAQQIVTTWLETPFGPGRHARRVEKIMEIERRFLKS